jgi:SAM-dependent methyltransferase
MTPPPHELYQQKLFSGSSHSWALSHFSLLSSSASVLDIGSGSGLMGYQLQQRGITDVSAVEVSAETRSATQQNYKHMVASLDQLQPNSSFDLVLLLDVLEHMMDPSSFLNTLAEKVKPGGKLLISVPNVAHWAIRLMLLAGYFEYMERGPLDKTHFRFFTRRGLHKLISSCPNLELQGLSGSIVPLELMLPEAAWKNPVFDVCSALRMKAAHALPSLFAYQLLAEVVRK